jgi:short subunit dehydrogenase-like uncharacterized protein
VAGRIVLFGATGYTGRLTAESLVERGAKPILAARDASKLEKLGGDLGGGLETATTDVSRPETVRELVEKGDVLVTTVGPFSRYGAAAVEAAIGAGAHYIDSTGESAFIRRVFEHWGPLAEASGSGLVTAFGYDYVPGNLAGALALEEAGGPAVKVACGYYALGGAPAGSGGTRASAAGAMLDSSFAYRDGRIVSERAAKRVRDFDVRGKQRPAVSIGMSEHFALPRSYPRLRNVDTYLGWFGNLSRPMQVQSAVMSTVMKLPPARMGANALVSRFVKGSSGGPDAEERAKSGSYVVAIAYDAADRPLAEVRMEGPNGYTYTGDILAWGAMRAAERGLGGEGALGPVEAFGLEELEAGNVEAGLRRA